MRHAGSPAPTAAGAAATSQFTSSTTTSISIALFGAPRCVDDVVAGCTGETNDTVTEAEIVVKDLSGNDITVYLSRLLGGSNASSDSFLAAPASSMTSQEALWRRRARPAAPGASSSFISTAAPPDVIVLACDASDTSSVDYLTQRALSVLETQFSKTPFFTLCIGEATKVDIQQQQQQPQPLASEAIRDLGAFRSSPLCYGTVDVSRRGTTSHNTSMGGTPRGRAPSPCGHANAAAGSASSLSAVPTRALTPSMPDPSAFVPFLQQAIDMVREPRHTLWDHRTGSITPSGQAALRRTFWLLQAGGSHAATTTGHHGSSSRAVAPLSDAATRRWHDAMYGTTVESDIASLKTFLEMRQRQQHASSSAPPGEVVTLLSADGRLVTFAGFMTINHHMLGHGQHGAVWNALRSFGIRSPLALPYSKDDMDRVPPSNPNGCDDDSGGDSVTVLSHNGVQFFRKLYVPKRAPNGNLADVWSFTPACPWEGIDGLPQPLFLDDEDDDDDDAAAGGRGERHRAKGGRASVSEGGGASTTSASSVGRLVPMSAPDFVACWRYVATLSPATVAEFAFWWGYSGDPALLFVHKSRRGHRQSDADLPNVLNVLVVGSPRCGKSALVQRLTNAPHLFAGHHANRCMAVRGGRGQTGGSQWQHDEPLVGLASVAMASSSHDALEPTLLVFTEVHDQEAVLVLRDHRRMDSVDLVLFLIDGSDSYSFSFAAHVYDSANVKEQYPSLPCLLVMTRLDLPVREPHPSARSESPAVFCSQRGLLWPPVLTSALSTTGELTSLQSRNAIDDLAQLCCDCIQYPQVAVAVPTALTKARLARRVVIVGIAAVVVIAITKWTAKALSGWWSGGTTSRGEGDAMMRDVGAGRTRRQRDAADVW